MRTTAIIYIITLVFLLTGCVSTKTYKTALDETSTTKAQLEETEKKLTAATQALEMAEKEIEGLNASVQALKAENQDQGRALEGKDEEIKALKSRVDELNTRKDYLEREVERLQVKAGEISVEKEKEIANITRTYDDLVKEMRQEIERGDIKITQAVDKLSVNFVEKILFDSGRAEIKPQGLEVLKRVGDILKNVTDKQIRVEGHTDNVPIGPRLRDRFPSNWELSTERATTVVRYLQDTVDLDPALLSAVGYSEFKPVAPNDTPEGRAQNRRIEIVLLPLDVDRVLEELKD